MNWDVACWIKQKESTSLSSSWWLNTESWHGGLIQHQISQKKLSLACYWYDTDSLQSISQPKEMKILGKKATLTFLFFTHGEVSDLLKFTFYLKLTLLRKGWISEYLLKTFDTKFFSYLKILLLRKIINSFPEGLTAKHANSMGK